MLDILTREVGEVTVLELRGSLVAGLGLERLRPCIEQLAAQERVKVVLNAEHVSVIDSAGIGDVVAAFSLLKKKGGGLKLANPGKLVREILKIARIPTLIGVYDTEDQAVQAFGG